MHRQAVGCYQLAAANGLRMRQQKALGLSSQGSA